MESKENFTLSSRQCQVLPYLVSSPSIEEAARRADISPKQIFAWLKEPHFFEELKKQRHTVFCDALAFLKVGTQKAAETMFNLLDNPDPRVQLMAADKILASALKTNELLDLEERLSTIESRIEKATKQQRKG